MDKNHEEFLRLNKDFLLLSALIKSHKAKTGAQLRWNKDEAGHVGQTSTLQQGHQSSSQNRKYVKTKYASGKIPLPHQHNKYVKDNDRLPLEGGHVTHRANRWRAPTAASASTSKGISKSKTSQTSQRLPVEIPLNGNDGAVEISVKSDNTEVTESNSQGDYLDQGLAPKVISTRPVVVSRKSKNVRCKISSSLWTYTNKDTVQRYYKAEGDGHLVGCSENLSKVFAVERCPSETTSRGLPSKPKVKIVSDLKSKRNIPTTINIHPNHEPQETSKRDDLNITESLRLQTHRRAEQVVTTTRKLLHANQDTTDEKALRGIAKHSNRHVPKEGIIGVAETCNPLKHSVAGPVVTRRKAEPETMVSSDEVNIGSDGKKASIKNVEVSLQREASVQRVDTGKAARVEPLATLEKNSRVNTRSNDDKDCEIARMKALSAYLTKLKNKPVAKGSESISPSTLKCLSSSRRKNNPAGKLPSSSHYPHSSAKTIPVRNLAAPLQGNTGIHRGKKLIGKPNRHHPVSSDEVSTKKRIKALTEDIKYIEEQLKNRPGSPSRTCHTGIPVKSNSPKGNSKYSWHTASSSNSIQGSHQVVVPQRTLGAKLQGISNGTRPKAKYSWHGVGTKQSNQGNNVRKVPRVTRTSTSHNMVKSMSNMQEKNPYKKVNTSKRTMSVSGSKSLQKTRSRFKVRKSQGPWQSGDRPGRGSRRKVNRGFSVSGQVVQRSMKSGQRPDSAVTRSPYKIHSRKHGKCYSPYKMRQQSRQRGLWDVYGRHSFVTRRLHHMVTHSPMLFRSNPVLGGHRSLHKLDRIWHSPRFIAQRFRRPVPPRSLLLSPHLPLGSPLHRTQLRRSRHDHSQTSKHSRGKQHTKKVMNVVKIAGVRYARHGKSLRRLTDHGEGMVTTPLVSPHGRITNTKIVAKQVLHRSIHFSHTLKSRRRKKQEYCMFFNRFGRCNKGDACTYKHDPEKVAICTRFLRGTCKLTGGTCLYSHKVTKGKMPVCRFFLKGVCTQEDCPYSHVKVNNSASICRDFVRGYCAKGEKCTQKHLLECADYSQTGQCLRKHCPLWHKKRTKSVGSQKGQKSKLVKRANTKPEPSADPHDSSSFIVLHDDHQIDPTETSSIDSSEDSVLPLQIRPVFMKKM